MLVLLSYEFNSSKPSIMYRETEQNLFQVYKRHTTKITSYTHGWPYYHMSLIHQNLLLCIGSRTKILQIKQTN